VHNPVDTYFVHLLFGSDSAFLDSFALTVTNAWLWVPLYIALCLLIIKNHDNMQQIFVCVGCAILGVLLATGLTSIVTKPLFERLRPCNDPEFKYLADIAGNIHNKDFSFFSSHAATSMAIVSFFCLLVRNWFFSFSMILWSLIVCWTRLYLGQHFFTDVLVGILWGNITGVLSYLLYWRYTNRIINKSYHISEKFTSGGISKFDVDVVLLVLFVSFLYALIPI